MRHKYIHDIGIFDSVMLVSLQIWANIIERDQLQIFATLISGDRPSYDFRKSAVPSPNMGVAKIRNLARTITRAQHKCNGCICEYFKFLFNQTQN